MSAWIVSSAHIDALVQGGIQFRLVPSGQDRHAVGAMLWQVNHDSVNYRYDETDQTPSYRFGAAEFLLEPWALLKAVNCYRYQSCEHPGWEASPAAEYTTRLTEAILAHLGVADDDAAWMWNNPQYLAAPWGIASLTEIAATAETTPSGADRAAGGNSR